MIDRRDNVSLARVAPGRVGSAPWLARRAGMAESEKSKRGAGALRSVVRAGVGCAVAAILINTWIVDGLFVPLVVSGGSMSPAWLGPHRLWQCAGCETDFRCNRESLPAPGRGAICPQCGTENDPARGVDRGGDRLLVLRSAFGWRPPRRWESVVVRSPDEPGALCVKRVVGLPGETIEIADGNVLVDGQLARKDLDALRAMAVRLSGPQATDRWQAEPGTWRKRDGWFVHDAREQDAIDWLSYAHREHAVTGAGRMILDSSPVDQSESRRLARVDDVLLRGEVVLARASEAYVRVKHRGDEFRLGLHAARGELSLARGTRTVRRLAVEDLGRLLARPAEMEFAVADGRVQFALGGGLLLRYDYRPVAAGAGDRAELAVGARGGECRVRKLEVLRDVHYTSSGTSQLAQYRLGDQEYYLLGDNSPHSRDSRRWSPRGGVAAGMLLGPALAWSGRTRMDE